TIESWQIIIDLVETALPVVVNLVLNADAMTFAIDLSESAEEYLSLVPRRFFLFLLLHLLLTPPLAAPVFSPCSEVALCVTLSLRSRLHSPYQGSSAKLQSFFSHSTA